MGLHEPCGWRASILFCDSRDVINPFCCPSYVRESVNSSTHKVRHKKRAELHRTHDCCLGVDAHILLFPPLTLTDMGFISLQLGHFFFRLSVWTRPVELARVEHVFTRAPARPHPRRSKNAKEKRRSDWGEGREASKERVMAHTTRQEEKARHFVSETVHMGSRGFEQNDATGAFRGESM